MRIEEISKEEFEEWLQSPVTQMLLSKLRQSAETYMFSLAGSAGIDPPQDRFVCGKIDTYLEISNVSFEEIKGES